MRHLVVMLEQRNWERCQTCLQIINFQFITFNLLFVSLVYQTVGTASVSNKAIKLAIIQACDLDEINSEDIMKSKKYSPLQRYPDHICLQAGSGPCV